MSGWWRSLADFIVVRGVRVASGQPLRRLFETLNLLDKLVKLL